MPDQLLRELFIEAAGGDNALAAEVYLKAMRNARVHTLEVAIGSSIEPLDATMDYRTKD